MKYLELLVFAFATTLIGFCLNYAADWHVVRDERVDVGEVTFYTKSRALILPTKGKSMEARIGLHLSNLTDSLTDRSTSADKGCFSWNDGSTLCVSRTQHSTADCYEISWLTPVVDITTSPWIKDCFRLSAGHWYGGAEVFHQHWPMVDLSFPMQEYVSRDTTAREDKSTYGSFVERYFLNSEGFSIKVHEEVPLWLSVNENNDDSICFMARYSHLAYPNLGRRDISLQYDVCVSSDVKAVHKHSMKTYFAKPFGIPDARMFQHPIWSTWARYKKEVNQSKVVEFAREIIDHGFKNSQMEIDDKWSNSYGDLIFDPSKYPDPKAMIAELHSLGFRATLWTTPFANIDSDILQSCLDYYWSKDEAELEKSSLLRSMFVKYPSGDVPVLVKWWNGYGALVDFTSPQATRWFIDRHEKLRETFAVDSFKFDAGEGEFVLLPHRSEVQLDNPAGYSKYYAEAVANFGGMIEVRTGHNTQHLAIFVRMMDKDSVWGYNNGLKTLIPTCLTLGIVGYPYILPDMIGGNVYYGQPAPSRELFIRWLEVTSFMPSMQFSVSPWEYADLELLGIAKKYVELHASYVTPLIIRFARTATLEDGAPIIRPIWWVSPHDEVALTTDDEFLIGDEVLVAPVLEKGALERHVYLPGPVGWKWKDKRTGKAYAAGQWLKNFPVPLDEVAYFEAIKISFL